MPSPAETDSLQTLRCCVQDTRVMGDLVPPSVNGSQRVCFHHAWKESLPQGVSWWRPSLPGGSPAAPVAPAPSSGPSRLLWGGGHIWKASSHFGCAFGCPTAQPEATTHLLSLISCWGRCREVERNSVSCFMFGGWTCLEVS